jgi:hypothetical protein
MLLSEPPRSLARDCGGVRSVNVGGCDRIAHSGLVGRSVNVGGCDRIAHSGVVRLGQSVRGIPSGPPGRFAGPKPPLKDGRPARTRSRRGFLFVVRQVTSEGDVP